MYRQMSAISITKVLQGSERNSGIMESCYKLYMWINYTVFMLLLQIFWKIRQISDYFSEEDEQDDRPAMGLEVATISKETKRRRHIRSMSDVQSSAPHYFRNYRKASYHTLYDCETRNRRRNQHFRPIYVDSSDSSDSHNMPVKFKSIERKILKPTDSMRIL